MLFVGFTVYSGASRSGMNSMSEIPVKIFDSDAYKTIKGE